MGKKGIKPKNFDLLFTPEAQEKKRLKLLGNKRSLGFKQSEETKRKKNEALRKIKHTKEWNKKVGDAQRGEKGNNWKGGTTSLIKQLRTCFKYRQWRSDVFTRDDFICQECSERGSYLEAHHIKEFSKIMKEYKIKTLEEALNCEELWNINNGRTLCLKCHNKTKKGNERRK